MDLKRAFTNYLNKSINDIYQTINGETAERPFKFETDFARNDGEFIMYDDNNRIVIDDKLNFIKFIPCSVLSIIADRIEIPDIQILDAIIPIEMFVTNDKLEEVMTILSLFQDKTNAKPIKLKADYKGEKDVNYTVVCSFNLPDDDAFTLFNGINGKLINFQIKANITKDVIFGNDIEYFLTIDNGVTYTKLPKYDTQASKNIVEYSDQKINSSDTTSLPKSSVWSLTTNAIVKKGSPLEDLIILTDFPIDLYDASFFDKCYLKTVYFFKENILPIQTVNINNQNLNFTLSNKKYKYIEITNDISLIAQLDGEIILKNNKNSYAINFGKYTLANGSVEIIIRFGYLRGSSFSNLYTLLHFLNNSIINENKETYIVEDFIIEGTNIKLKDTYSGEITFSIHNNTMSDNTTLNFIKLCSGNSYVKPILITNMSYDSAYGDFVSLSLEIKERMTL